MNFNSEINSVIVKGEYCVEDNVFAMQNSIEIATGTLASDVDESKVKFEITEIEDDSPNIRYHRSNENDNQCGICGKKFTRRANLEMHMDIHPKPDNESQEEPEVEPKKGKKSVNAKETLPRKKAKTLQAKEKSEKIDKNSDKDRSKRKKNQKKDPFKLHPFSCAHCSSTFSHKRSLVRHMLVFHIRSKKPQKDLSCLICQKKYTDFQSLGTHMWKHSKEKPSTCKICGEKFLYKFLHDRHFELNHKEEKELKEKKKVKEFFSCPHCDRISKTPSAYYKHLTTHSFECYICSQKFKTKYFLKKHMRQHQKPSYCCHICDDTFTEKNSLKDHIVKHMENFTKCIYCSKVFTKPHSYRKHIEKVHTGLPIEPSADKEVECTICGEIFEEIKDLKSHVLIHQTHVDCNFCGDNFPKEELGDHIRQIHENEHNLGKCAVKKYSCPHCEKWFKGKKYFLTHLDIHKNDKIYKCPICPKTFTQKNLLTNHKILHKTASIFRCNLCDRIFKSGWLLMIHEKQHDLEEDTIECPDCNGSGFILSEQCNE